MSSVEPVRSVRSEVAFTRPEDLRPDPERPGLLCGPDVDPYAGSERRFQLHEIEVRDCAALEGFTPDLVEHGFARADLSGDAELQAVLERVRAAARLAPEDEQAIRDRLAGARLPLGGGRFAEVSYIAPEGFLLRTPGPNGLQEQPGKGAPGTAGLDGARGVHADQDVGGTPLRELMDGQAPRLFHHDSPDGRNADSTLHLLNVWIPLEQATRPLALMDGRTLDRKRHQARFGLKVDRLLGRESERAVNHVWAFVHDGAQRWYFDSEMGPESAWVFETLSAPHVSLMLPGEDAAEARHGQLGAVLDAVEAGDAEALARAARKERADPDPSTPASLRRAIAAMDALLEDAATRPDALCAGEASGFAERARRAQQAVVRKSIEMRAVCTVTSGGA